MIAVIVLAAGASTRMGRQKLTLPLADGRPLVRAAVEQVLAADLDDVVVVLGREAEAVASALRGLPIRMVVNSRYAEGQSTSLRAGSRRARARHRGRRCRAGRPAASGSSAAPPARGSLPDQRAPHRRAPLPGRPRQPGPLRIVRLRRAPPRRRGPGRTPGHRAGPRSGSPRCPSTRRCRPTSTLPTTTRPRAGAGGTRSRAPGPLYNGWPGRPPDTTSTEEPACARRSDTSRP